MARTSNTMMTDTGRKRKRAVTSLGMSRSPVSGSAIHRSNVRTPSYGDFLTGATTVRKPMTSTQKAYTSLAHKSPRTSATPIRPAKSKYKKKPL